MDGRLSRDVHELATCGLRTSMMPALESDTDLEAGESSDSTDSGEGVGFLGLEVERLERFSGV